MRLIEKFLEYFIFNSRWVMAPMYIGLCAAMALVMVKFGQEFVHFAPNILTMDESSLVLSVLKLVDLTLFASLLLMVIFSGYENFVSKIDMAEHKDRPEWMGKVDFSGLKLKLIGSIVAISGIHLLDAFITLHTMIKAGVNPDGHGSVTKVLLEPAHVEALYTNLKWMIVLHTVFIISGIGFALMDKIAHGSHKKQEKQSSPSDLESHQAHESH
ncbi:MAG: hypothetical protein RL095_1402 [Verrucomicrobiota bacterium]|jgi:uncharacterized protein (TIGR00645 family)